MLAVALVILLATAPAVPEPGGVAVVRVPDEPTSVVLSEAGTYQAVVADVDDDGVRDLVRLVAGERGAIDLEAWGLRDGRPERIGAALNIVPVRPTGGQGNIVYAGAPVRLVVRAIGAAERATLVRQPRFEEPGLEVDCCLLLDDVRIVDGAPALLRVADRGPSADAVLVLDLDGDGTDELLASRGLPPLGDTTFPTAARVYRWQGDRFGPPTFSDLSVGSGVSPFVLGDSDGVPGEEAGVIAAQARLHRLSLRDGDRLVAETGPASVADALAVPIDDGRGIAINGRLTGLDVHAWPRDGGLDPGVAATIANPGDLLGVVRLEGVDRLLVRDAVVEALHVLTLPTLVDLGSPTVTRSPAAGTLAASPLRPFSGSLPGDGPDGAATVLWAGRMLPLADRDDAPFFTRGSALFPTLAGAWPVGMLGPDRGWLAIQHAPLPLTPIDPDGGRLEPPVLQPGSGVSLVPFADAVEPERDDGELDPPVGGAVEDGRTLLVPAEGFVARVEAPSGSRVALASADPSVLADVRIVPASGVLEVAIAPPRSPTPVVRFRATVAVGTPAGRGYLASWNVRVLDRPPPLDAGTTTPFGSGNVAVTGRTAPGTTVTVDGSAVEVDADGRFSADVAAPPWPTRIEVTAIDPVGNMSRVTVTGIGWFDYRALPWAGLALALVAAAGIVLFLRAPRAAVVPRPPEDEGVLEELDPDDDDAR